MASLLRCLSLGGNHIHCLALNTQKHNVQKGEVPPSLAATITLHAIEANTTPTRVGALKNLFSKESYMTSRFYVQRYADVLQNLLKEKSFDLVVVDGFTQAVYWPILRALFSGPIAYRAHNIEHLVWERAIQQPMGFIRRWYLTIQNQRLRRFEEEISHQAHAIWTITETDAAWFLHRKKPHSSLISVPCTASHWPGPPTTVSSGIFHLGALDWWPNTEGLRWFFEAVWPLAQSMNPTLSVRILSRNSPLEWIKKRNGVHFVSAEGGYEEATTPWGISIIPLHSGSGMRIKALEAMVYGKVMVSTALGVEGLGLTTGVHYLEANSPEDFANALCTLSADAPLRLSLAQNAYRHAQLHFSDETISLRLQQELKQWVHE